MKVFFKIVRYRIFNLINKTRINSINASLKASYGFNVGVAQDTIVTSDVIIGDYSYINSNSFIENCVIGKFCSISSGVHIAPFEHTLTYKTTHPILYNKMYGFTKSIDKTKRRKVTIGNDVLISINAIILEGISIGDGAVIAAGSVVTKDVNPYEIVGGVPAKLIKYRFDADTIEILQSEKFWDWSKEKIINNMDYLKNESEFIHE